MAFLDKTGLQNLTNKLVQGDAIKVASHRGKNVKEVIDNIQRECENVALPNTMTLENRVNEFKVGQGRDINVSNDIEESKIELKLKGQTYHNLCKSNCDISCQYPSNFNIETYSDRIVVTRINENNSGWAYCRNNTLKIKMLKPSTVYTLFFKYETNFTNVPRVQFVQGNALQYLSDAYNVTKIKDNIYMCKITTLSSFDNKEIGAQILYFHNTAPYKTGNKITLYKDMILLEGDYSETPIDEIPKYFEDMKSSFEDKVVSINVQGKNLFDFNNKSISLGTGVTYNKIGNKFEVSSDSTSKTYANAMISFPAELFEGKTVALSCKSTQTNTSANPSVQIYYIDANHQNRYIGFWNRTTIHTFPDKINSDHVKLGLYPNNTNTSAIVNTIHVEDIMAEESKVKTDYEEAYNYSYKFDIKEPLRRLPNDAYDEIRNNNGQWELVRRTATAIINGTEPWERSYSDWNNIVFCCSDNYFPGIRSIDVNTKNVIANTLPSLHIGALCSGLGNTGICSHNWSTKKLQVAIKDIDTVEELKAWFADNPTEIIYELTNPIITPIDPIEFNISQGATVSINSDIAPVSTYDAVLNRAGQIEQGISLIANLKSRVNTLESIYDSNLIATQYKLDNLKLNYELEREED